MQTQLAQVPAATAAPLLAVRDVSVVFGGIVALNGVSFDMKKWIAFVDKYAPGANKSDSGLVYGYGAAQTLHKVLEMCGDNLTRENVMKQAASLKDFQTDVALPGVKINTSATDFAPIQQVQMMRFKGEKWELFGDVISSDAKD